MMLFGDSDKFKIDYLESQGRYAVAESIMNAIIQMVRHNLTYTRNGVMMEYKTQDSLLFDYGAFNGQLKSLLAGLKEIDEDLYNEFIKYAKEEYDSVHNQKD